MPWTEASIAEICREGDQYTVRLSCSNRVVAVPGQYILADLPAHTPAQCTATAVTLFPTQLDAHGLYAVPAYPTANTCQIPAAWQPGSQLLMRGPLGRGFYLPGDVRRLLLVAAGSTGARLSPLIAQAQAQRADIVLCTHLSTAALPSSIEAYPLRSFAGIVSWADFIAVDVLLEDLPGLRQQLGLSAEQRLPCPAQALLLTPMPCGGLAACGACAVHTDRGYRFVCEDGPVFALDRLDW
ncbi:MAG: hypothetical protein ACOYYS_25535 [Chloroflexota bacterium]